MLAQITLYYPALFPNGKASNKSWPSNIEASDTETIKVIKVKASLFDIRIEKCKKGFLIPFYLELTYNLWRPNTFS